MTNLKYFTLDEFDSPDLKNSGVNMCPKFLQQLDKARSISKVAFKITSGYRTKEHHEAIYKKLGKKPTKSAHLEGKAADISATTSRERYIILYALLKAGFTRIGVGSNFIHCDTSTTKAEQVIWTY